jgi:hypothetical protein
MSTRGAGGAAYTMTIPRPTMMRALWLAIAVLTAASPSRAQVQPETLERIPYTLRVIDREKHVAGVEARVPTGGRPAIELMMPVWTPGYYVLEDYAARVRDLVVKAPDGSSLAVSKPKPNRWSVEASGAPYEPCRTRSSPRDAR